MDGNSLKRHVSRGLIWHKGYFLQIEQRAAKRSSVTWHWKKFNWQLYRWFLVHIKPILHLPKKGENHKPKWKNIRREEEKVKKPWWKWIDRLCVVWMQDYWDCLGQQRKDFFYFPSSLQLLSLIFPDLKLQKGLQCIIKYENTQAHKSYVVLYNSPRKE